MEPEKPKKSIFTRFLRSYRSLPQKKQYVEFFTAILSIPVLLTVIILNVSNLRGEDKSKEAAPTVQPKIVVTIPEQKNSTTSNQPVAKATPAEACKKGIGPIDISDPAEGDSVKDNPIMITVDRPDEGYCAVVWSYKINGGRWSEYDDKSIALYNPPKGQITLDLRVKSVVTGEEKIITRKFSYDGSSDNTASSSASVSN